MEEHTAVQAARQDQEVRFQFDTTLAQAAVDGNLMPLMLFSMRRGRRPRLSFLWRGVLALIAVSLCFLQIPTVTLLALLLAAFLLWDLYGLTIHSLRRQLRACIRFAQRQNPGQHARDSRVRIFFTDRAFSVWNPDEGRKLMEFPLTKIFAVESDELFFITFEQKQKTRGLRRVTSRTTTVVRKDAMTYGTLPDFRTFLETVSGTPVRTFSLHFPEAADLMDELNRCNAPAAEQKQ